MQNWKDLYTELSNKLADGIPALQWIDLWHNQINFLEEEHPFPTPAVFLQFRSMGIQDMGERVQQLQLQVDVYVYYETFADTYKDSFNQDTALAFLDLLNAVHACLHASGGDNYSNMRRIALNPIDTGNAGNLYMISFECVLVDYAAQVAWQDAQGNEIDLTHEAPPPPEEDEDKIFIVEI